MFKYVLVFIAGAVTYHFSALYLVSSYTPGSVNEYNVPLSDGGNEAIYGASNSYFDSELQDVCNYLSENSCSCKPVVRTEYRCKNILNEFVQKKMFGQ